jgi:hypothetical protein
MFTAPASSADFRRAQKKRAPFQGPGPSIYYWLNGTFTAIEALLLAPAESVAVTVSL